MISSYGSPFVTLSITLHFQAVTLHVLNLCSLVLHTQLICIRHVVYVHVVIPAPQTGGPRGPHKVLGPSTAIIRHHCNSDCEDEMLSLIHI